MNVFADPDDFHRWVSPDCPDCPCCTAVLCHRAKQQNLTCSHLAAGSPSDGAMDVSRCPCTAPTVDPQPPSTGPPGTDQP